MGLFVTDSVGDTEGFFSGEPVGAAMGDALNKRVVGDDVELVLGAR